MRALSFLFTLLIACSGVEDLDGDGYCADPESCAGEALPGDCDETDAEIHPGAAEWCDGIDTDCDGAVDEPQAIDANPWYVDADGDGFGDSEQLTKACGEPSGWAGVGGDCDDSNGAIHPGATDTPGDGVDTDCDPSTGP